jgi:hypothetical protein
VKKVLGTLHGSNPTTSTIIASTDISLSNNITRFRQIAWFINVAKFNIK